MLIVRTPMRVSFFGGGTDYPSYFTENGGSVISTTINKYCYVTLRRLPPIFTYENQLSYSKIEYFNTPSELRHPLVRAALEYLPTNRIQINYDADLPACAGLGSSSAFAVGLLQGLHALREEYPDRMTLAKEAIYLERDVCREAGGVQDQLAVAFGGLKRYDFSAEGYAVREIEISANARQTLFENLLLIFTGFTRFAGVVSAEQAYRVYENTAALREMQTLVDTAEALLCAGDTEAFGRLLDQTWQLKRTLSGQISTDAIDEIYRQARACGALGGKLLGAGGGGFLLLYVPREKQDALKRQMQGFRFVPFAPEDSGTQIIYQN